MNAIEVINLAGKEGLVISEEGLKINESGVDFRVASGKDQAGDKWILRMPRRKESMRHAQKEKRALDTLSNLVDFQVPHWSVFSENLIAYKQLDGVPAATIDMKKQAYVWELDEHNPPDIFYESLGKVMAGLHSVDVRKFNDTGVPIIQEQDLRISMKSRMDKINEQFEIHPALWERWQTWLANEKLWPHHIGVRHGDLHPGHILINGQQAVTGLIDWTEIAVDDVSIDFTAHYQIFGEKGLNKLISAYDNAGGITWPTMQEHINELLAASPLTVAEYALVSGIPEMKEMAVHMLSQGE
ncbi:macrolide 2'-phosphotransferase [Jeotgalibacillus sp. R-1-5s-1]|uniref:macrolide 2'-phosphotransferase n=1 Tax=Jeotgalibacillus sp. R-1-5s-1 TaxID=2555897 RepID=UPI00106D80B9|nr:macrolide 2'-phosphotransferase [Jeotgalibacillus sp. R-1-5s-1]TFD93622.1 Mph(B) family macrolide 2'-phosphotransferase [Jeotgalibacillus sp. R-1-5s-1]